MWEGSGEDISKLAKMVWPGAPALPAKADSKLQQSQSQHALRYQMHGVLACKVFRRKPAYPSQR